MITPKTFDKQLGKIAARDAEEAEEKRKEKLKKEKTK